LLELDINGAVICPGNSRKYHACDSACNCSANAEPQTVAFSKRQKTDGGYGVCLFYKSAATYTDFKHIIDYCIRSV
jgi:hypothetical protein